MTFSFHLSGTKKKDLEGSLPKRFPLEKIGTSQVYYYDSPYVCSDMLSPH